MSILDKASLIQIPSGYKSTKLYSLRPINGTGDFTFSRSSSGTRLNSQGLVEEMSANVPRLDYSDGSCASLLLEPQRTNLVTYSEDFSNAYWTKSGASVVSGFTSPDGTTNAFKLVEDTSTGGHLIQKIITVSAATIYTTSVFVKYAGREWIRFTDAQSSNRIHFNTLTGVFGTSTGTVIDYNSTALGDGWHKLSLTTTSVGTAYTPRITLAEADNDIVYTGDGTSGVYLYGAQLEQGSYPTSYIISNSGTSTTRTADVCNNAGTSATFNSTEGVLFAEIKSFISTDPVEQNRYITLTNGTSNERVALLFGGNTNQLRAIIFSSTQSINLSFSTTATETKQFNKLAVRYKSGDYAFYLNGVEIGSSTESSIFSANTLDDLSFDVGGGTQQFRGKCKQLMVFDEALSDSELTTLTT